ncbi:hypothetical protein DH2020_012188 [Rehmannia glutinosa]|uniref:MADS-box domain-containing protein n=1 Tax=Rehmannia glutinosa TaxID=99300 RepID=A0ABR0W353_REHGL
MDRKKTKGRQKIPIARIEKESDCFATFSKRRLGVFRKASEISTLCNVDIGIIIYSPTGKPFSFFHPTMESIVGRVQNQNPRLNDASRLLEAYTRNRVFQLNHMLDKFAGELEAEKEREKQLDNVVKSRTGGGGQGWWGEPVDNFNKEQVEEFTGWLKHLQTELVKELEK